MKHSLFRIAIVAQAKSTFEQFFDKEKKAQECVDAEKKAIWEEKLFGNMEFVGELFRRKMVSNGTLIEIFMQLLGKAGEVEDLLIEAAINLMNKTGPKFEEEIARQKNKQKKKDEAKGQKNNDKDDEGDKGEQKMNLETEYESIFLQF